MALTIKGKVVKILPLQQGEGRNGIWKKQSFIIETLDYYPKKICLMAWNERTDIVSSLSINDEVTVECSIESREFNDRWYTDVRALNISRNIPSSTPSSIESDQSQSEPASSPQPPTEATDIQDDNDLPF
ncbi:MAG TPA: hypothetical protein DCX03_01130 [Bacteroidales bacterium]|jgi:hypothetical protein|nr:hypothetical protein [Bacteroidales bacterium]HQN98432.1 DUF3127 domain-containing protein [Bacteroidales bacterium]HQQ02588.1 DUF3127 domain-containing protein [Bacteroidales bacterium]